ncbi:MAG: aminoacyl-tRNA hydrolase [Planctomycetota bacterium]
MKLVVGLGNPGTKYIGTRHNIGFDVLSAIAKRFEAGTPKTKFKGEVVEVIIGGHKTVLLSPLTYMNLSGQSVRAAVDFYKLELSEILVICDDLNLECARLRIRPGGSAGGQNGIKNIIDQLASQAFSRLKVGIGRPPENWDTADFVLGKFAPNEIDLMKPTVERAAVAVEFWVEHGIQKAMNRFNADPKKPDRKRIQKPALNEKPLPNGDSQTHPTTNNENNQG